MIVFLFLGTSLENTVFPWEKCCVFIQVYYTEWIVQVQLWQLLQLFSSDIFSFTHPALTPDELDMWGALEPIYDSKIIYGSSGIKETVKKE